MVASEPGGVAQGSPSPATGIAGRYLLSPQARIPGNALRLLRDGVEAYPRMLSAIDAATRTVRLETYIFADDAVGQRFGRALCAAAQRGVDVTVLYDALGSWWSRRSFFKGLERAGVRLSAFRPLWPWQWTGFVTRRDHRKLLVVDGRRAFVGGVNIAECWAPSGPKLAWRDDVLEIVGPAAASLDGLFRLTWRTQAERIIGRPFRRESRGTVEIGILAARRAIHRAYLHAIDRARRSVLIAAGYFVPDPRMLWALRRARARGVEVSLILAGKSDHWIVQYAGRAYYERLLSWGVRVFEWRDAVLHAKTAVIDGTWATVGSFNLDRWSLFRNHELNLVFEDPRLAREMDARFREDCRACAAIVREAWPLRPRRQRLLEALCYLLRRWL